MFCIAVSSGSVSNYTIKSYYHAGCANDHVTEKMAPLDGKAKAMHWSFCYIVSNRCSLEGKSILVCLGLYREPPQLCMVGVTNEYTEETSVLMRINKKERCHKFTCFYLSWQPSLSCKSFHYGRLSPRYCQGRIYW